MCILSFAVVVEGYGALGFVDKGEGGGRGGWVRWFTGCGFMGGKYVG